MKPRRLSDTTAGAIFREIDAFSKMSFLDDKNAGANWHPYHKPNPEAILRIRPCQERMLAVLGEIVGLTVLLPSGC
jgi:hypothetical protein